MLTVFTLSVGSAFARGGSLGDGGVDGVAAFASLIMPETSTVLLRCSLSLADGLPMSFNVDAAIGAAALPLVPTALSSFLNFRSDRMNVSG